MDAITKLISDYPLETIMVVVGAIVIVVAVAGHRLPQSDKDEPIDPY